VTGVADGFAIELGDDVAATEAGTVGGTARGDFGEEGAGGFLEVEFAGEGGGDVLGQDTEVTAVDLAVGDEGFEDIAAHVGGDGETDALIAAGTRDDGGIDPDQAAIGIDECAAGVAGIDGGIGLDEVLVGKPEGGATGGADDAHGDGLADAERIADGEGDVADLNDVAVGEGGGRELVGVNFQDGDVGLVVPSDDPGGELAAIGEFDLHLIGAFDDVVVGQDVAVFGYDHPGADSALFGGGVPPGIGDSEEEAEGILGSLHGGRATGRSEDLDDGGGDLLDDGSEGSGKVAFADKGFGIDGKDGRRILLGFIPGLEEGDRSEEEGGSGEEEGSPTAAA